MKKPETYTYDEACKDLRIAQTFYNAGDLRKAYDMLESLAHYVVSSYAKSTVEADKLQQLRSEVEKAISQYSYCQEEALWEKASELSALFRD